MMGACSSDSPGASVTQLRRDESPGSSNRMLSLINAERAKVGASALTWNSLLESSALRHSRDMERHSFMNHKGSDGSKFDQRIRDAGYHYRTAGENIARGYTSEVSVMQAWMSSPGHRANILNRTFTEVGVARAGNYWTQNFAAPSKKTGPASAVQPAKAPNPSSSPSDHIQHEYHMPAHNG